MKIKNSVWYLLENGWELRLIGKILRGYLCGHEGRSVYKHWDTNTIFTMKMSSEDWVKEVTQEAWKEINKK